MLPRENERQKQMRNILDLIEHLSITDLAELRSIAMYNAGPAVNNPISPFTPTVQTLYLRLSTLLKSISDSDTINMSTIMGEVGAILPADKSILSDRLMGVLGVVTQCLPRDYQMAFATLSVAIEHKRIELELPADAFNQTTLTNDIRVDFVAAQKVVSRIAETSKLQILHRADEARKIMPHFPLHMQFGHMQYTLRKKLEASAVTQAELNAVQAIHQFRNQEHRHGIRGQIKDFEKLLKSHQTNQNKAIFQAAFAEMKQLDKALASQQKAIDKSIDDQRKFNAKPLSVSDKVFEPYLAYKHAMKNAATMIKLLETKSSTLSGKDYDINQKLIQHWEKLFFDMKELYQPMLQKSDANSTDILKFGLKEIMRQLASKDLGVSKSDMKDMAALLKPLQQSLDASNKFVIARKVDADALNKKLNSVHRKLNAAMDNLGIATSHPFVNALAELKVQHEEINRQLQKNYNKLEQANDPVAMRQLGLHAHDLKVLHQNIGKILAKPARNEAALKQALQSEFSTYLDKHPQEAATIKPVMVVLSVGRLIQPPQNNTVTVERVKVFLANINYPKHPNSEAIKTFITTLTDQYQKLLSDYDKKVAYPNDTHLGKLRAEAESLREVVSHLMLMHQSLPSATDYPNPVERQAAIDQFVKLEVYQLNDQSQFPASAIPALKTMLQSMEQAAPTVVAAPAAPTTAAKPKPQPNPMTLFHSAVAKTDATKPVSKMKGDLADILSPPPLGPKKP